MKGRTLRLDLRIDRKMPYIGAFDAEMKIEKISNEGGNARGRW